MSHAYTEDSLVEQPAIQLFAPMGWQTVSALEEVFGVGGTLGRETKGEAVPAPCRRNALEHLNPSVSPEAVSGSLDQLISDRFGRGQSRRQIVQQAVGRLPSGHHFLLLTRLKESSNEIFSPTQSYVTT